MARPSRKGGWICSASSQEVESTELVWTSVTSRVARFPQRWRLTGPHPLNVCRDCDGGSSYRWRVRSLLGPLVFFMQSFHCIFLFAWCGSYGSRALGI